jgi:hypothetical protein
MELRLQKKRLDSRRKMAKNVFMRASCGENSFYGTSECFWRLTGYAYFHCPGHHRAVLVILIKGYMKKITKSSDDNGEDFGARLEKSYAQTKRPENKKFNNIQYIDHFSIS